MTLSETFRAALRTCDAPPPAASPDGKYSAEELEAYMSKPLTLPTELLAVLAEIQALRDQSPALDQWLRERGIVTREKKVRP